MRAGRADKSAAQIDTPGKALDIGQSRPDRSIQIVKLHVSRDEPVAGIKANSGANKGTIDIDDVGLQHGRGPFRTEVRNGQVGLASR